MPGAFNFKRPEEGGDPCLNWKYICDIMDALENFTISITPEKAGVAIPSEGDIELRITCVTNADAPNLIAQYGGGGSEDSGSGDTGTDGASD